MIKIGGQRVPTRTLLLIASDMMLMLLAILLGILLRFLDFNQALAYMRQHQSVGRFSVVVVVCCVILYFYDLYEPEILGRKIELFVRTLQALGTACLILAILYYFDPSRSLGRGIALLAAPFIVIFTMGWRFLVGPAGMITDPVRVLVVGTGAAGISVVREILSRPELHLQVVGFLDEKGQNIGKSLVNPGIIGGVSDLENVVEERKIKRLILSLGERRGNTPVRELLQMKFAGIAVEDAHSFHERTTGRIPLEHLAPSWLILSEGFSKSTLLTYSKRAVDIVTSVLALILATPIMIGVAIAIVIESGWPIFFRQERTGLNGRSFQIMKFRSMYQNAEAHGPVWASTDDKRITRAGKFIRKARFDELPQLINVLKGEMSLVGPRPERPVFCQILEQQIPYYGLRHSVRPGITGWAQIKYQYGGSVEEAKTKLEYDLFYVKHISMVLDLAILCETAKVVIYGRGAK